MRVLRDCKMSLDAYGGKSRVLLGLLFLSCVPPVWTRDYFTLNSTVGNLTIGDRLVSTPKGYFEFGIFVHNYSLTGGTQSRYFLTIKYAPPIPEVVTWMSNRDSPLSDQAFLLFRSNGFLQLTDPMNNSSPNDIWNTDTDNKDVVSAQLLDTGALVLKNQNGMEVWNSFYDSPPTDTLLPGQGMNRSRGHKLVSIQRTGDPSILNVNDTYSFGWDASGVLALSWTCPKVYLHWKGGSYIPAPDVYGAHTIRDVDSVYFHKDLGHLYIGSNPPTAILSGGPDRVNDTTLKRIQISSDGGLRILQYTIPNEGSNETLNQTWKAVANWVVSDRPDSRSQCTTFGTCGAYSQCVSQFDSLEPVTCQCPGSDDNTTKPWFTPIDDNDIAKGCQPSSPPAECLIENGTYITVDPNVRMLKLDGVDMPWGGDYRNLTGNLSANCEQECLNDCRCAGAVLSIAEAMCWLKNGAVYNIGYPTEALHGTDRTSFLKNQRVLELPPPRAAKRNNKLAKILGLAIGIPVALLFLGVIIYLWRNRKIPGCGSRSTEGTSMYVYPGPPGGS